MANHLPVTFVAKIASDSPVLPTESKAIHLAAILQSELGVERIRMFGFKKYESMDEESFIQKALQTVPMSDVGDGRSTVHSKPIQMAAG